MTVVLACFLALLDGGIIGYALARLLPRAPRAPGIPIKLRHQADSLRFSVGEVLTIDDPVELAFMGCPSGNGTFEGDLMVIEVDHAAGEITVRAR